MVKILDSTLREGEQSPGVCFEPHIKAVIAGLLDGIGVDIIEAGHPAASKRIFDSVKQLSSLGTKALIGAHARSLEKDIDSALECNAGFLGVFFCVSEGRLNEVFKIDLKAALERISSTIAYAKAKNPKLVVRFTPEDSVRSGFQNVLSAAQAALEAGAGIISIADTTGFLIPGTEKSMFNFVSRLKSSLSEIGFNPEIEVHCHNDRGFALANSIDAFRAGAEIIDASVLGLGERTGITDLAQLLAVLSEDFNEGKWNLKLLPELYSFVSQHSKHSIPSNFPITGSNAFTHCAGVHTNAASINPLHYESLNPERFGRERSIALGHMSGISSIKWALEKLNETASPDLMLQVLETVKSVGEKGRIVDFDELRQILQACRQKASVEITTQKLM